MSSVYDAAGGSDGLLRLAEAWHHRVTEDDVVSHAFSHGFHPDHTERLAAYWAEALGGPVVFTQRYGNESTVVRMHSGNGPHEEMDQRAIVWRSTTMQPMTSPTTSRCLVGPGTVSRTEITNLQRLVSGQANGPTQSAILRIVTRFDGVQGAGCSSCDRWASTKAKIRGAPAVKSRLSNSTRWKDPLTTE